MTEPTRPTAQLKGLLLCLVMIGSTGHAQPDSLRVDPPHWYSGYEHGELQLMIHGSGIARFQPEVDGDALSITRVVRTGNPNYLFVYLDVSRARPDEYRLEFSDGERRFDLPYSLKARHADPKRTRGFDASDVMVLITPDRFANGDPGNDDIEGMGDPVDRSNPNGRHGGDIQGIIDHLDYLQDMGFTALWISPVLENRMPEFSYHGYGITDLYQVDRRFGTNDQYVELVDAARSRGMGMVMDMIVNHIGLHHPWMSDLPAPDWINGQLDDYRFTSHYRTTNMDPYASEDDRAWFADGWFVEDKPDLNQRQPLLGDYLIQNALWWIEYLGLQGIRMDTYPYNDKHFMAEWNRRVLLEYPDFTVVGEEWSMDPAIVSYWQRGKVNPDGYTSDLPSLMDFPLGEALKKALEEPEVFDRSGWTTVYRMLADDFLYPAPGDLVVFPDNHDMDRIFTRLGEDVGAFRLALAYLLTIRGTPQIYYGTEILMSNTGYPGHHGWIRSDFPGGWPDDRVNAFTGEGLNADQLEVQQELKTLMNWRKDQPVVHKGRLEHYVPVDGIYVYFRYDLSDSVMVVLNRNDKAMPLALDRFQARLNGYGAGVDVLTGQRHELDEVLQVPARAPMILDLER